jgi:hypothetical protein
MKRFVLKSGLLTPALVLLLTFFAAKSASATTYYVSTSGADTNNGTSKTTPWAHLPGMPTATGNASSHKMGAGDTFILRGCDVWYNANLPLVMDNGGSSGSPVTITVDQTWYNTTNCPSTWNRPVFDAKTSAGANPTTEINGTGGQASGCVSGNGNYFMVFEASYITVNWIELRDLYYQNDAENSCYGQNGWWRIDNADYVTVDYGYEHIWSMGPYNASSSNDGDEFVLIDGSPTCPHCMMQYNVADNCATHKGEYQEPGGALSMTNVKYSHYGCMSNSYKPLYAGEFGWNEIVYNAGSPDPTIHANCIESVAAMGNGGVYYIHDNRIHDNYDCEELQIGNQGETDYVWNNIWYNPNLLNPSQANGPEVPQSETPVAMYFWNNTVVDSADGCMGNAGHGSTFSTAFKSQNNLCINPTGSASNASFNPFTTSNNLGLTDSQATTDGYTNSQTVAYSPTSSSSPTVGAGTNLTSVWPAGFSTQDAGLICTMQTVNTVVQMVCTGTPIPRPTSGAWDIGAYQFSAASSAKPNPPTNVKAIAQ